MTDHQGTTAMNAIRFTGALALAGMLAGCAGTQGIGPTTAMTKPAPAAKPAPAPVAGVPVAETPVVVQAPTQTHAAALPERVAALPAPRAIPARPARKAAPVAAMPAPAPAPVYRSAPVAVAVAAPPRYEPVETAAPPVRTVALPDPVAVARPDPAQYTPVGDLDAPAPAAPAAPTYVAPAYVAAPEPAPAPVRAFAPAPEPVYEQVAQAPEAAPTPLSRAMSPIRDDPRDGRNDRRASNDEIRQHARKGYQRHAALRAGGRKPKVRSNFTPAFGMKLEDAALARLNPGVRYDARYVPIGYPWGDVDEATGVCTDVVIRSYRKLGIDLQQMVHEDMKRAFRAYPSKRIYGLRKADPNIDHRRVVNLEAFFERTGASIPIGTGPDDFIPGDVLTWRLSGNEPHIGIVVSDRDPRTGMPLVVHNLGAGVRKEDLITLSPPVGHFRFAPDRQTVVAALVTK